MRFSGSQKVALSPRLPTPDSVSVSLSTFTFLELLLVSSRACPGAIRERLKNFDATEATTTTASTANVSEQTTAAYCYTFSSAARATYTCSALCPARRFPARLPDASACASACCLAGSHLFALRLMSQLYLCSAARRDRDCDCDCD